MAPLKTLQSKVLWTVCCFTSWTALQALFRLVTSNNMNARRTWVGLHSYHNMNQQSFSGLAKTMLVWKSPLTQWRVQVVSCREPKWYAQVSVVIKGSVQCSCSSGQSHCVVAWWSQLQPHHICTPLCQGCNESCSQDRSAQLCLLIKFYNTVLQNAGLEKMSSYFGK